MMQKWIVILCMMLALCGAAVGQTIYVSMTDGDDANVGNSSLVPIKTLDRASQLLNNSVGQNNMTFYLKRGDIWRGTLVVNKSGTSGNRIIIDAYGTGDKPRILGSHNMSLTTNWTLKWASVYESTDVTLPNSISLAWYNTNNNNISRMRYAALTTDMTQNWDFYYNSTSDTIYVFHTGGNPASMANGIEIPNYQTSRTTATVGIDEDNYITIANLSIWYSRYYQLRTRVSEHIQLLNNDLYHSTNIPIVTDGYMSGKTFVYSNNILIKGNIINYSSKEDLTGVSGEGIFINTCKNVTIIDNKISNTGGTSGVGYNCYHSTSTYFINNTIKDQRINATLSRPTIYYDGCNDSIAYSNIVENQSVCSAVNVESDYNKSVNISIYNNLFIDCKQPIQVVTDDQGTIISNINYSHNTIVRLRNQTSFTDMFWLKNGTNISLWNNIVMSYPDTATDLRLLRWYNSSTPGLSANYNAYYSTTNENNFSTYHGVATYYAGLPAWQAQFPSLEQNSIYDNVLNGTHTTYSYELPYFSQAIDTASWNHTTLTDYYGNPRYGMPDIGAIEYQPPWNISSDVVCNGAQIRVYGDGKFRYTAYCSGSAVTLLMMPVVGWGIYAATDLRPVFGDINISSFTTSSVVFGQNFTSTTNMTYALRGLSTLERYDIYFNGTLNTTTNTDITGSLTFSLYGLHDYSTISLVRVSTTATILDDIIESFFSMIGWITILINILIMTIIIRLVVTNTMDMEAFKLWIISIFFADLLIAIFIIIFDAMKATL